MRSIGKKVAQWVDSQSAIAEEIGVTSASMHSMLTGKIKFPLPRFLQVIYYLNPPADEVDEIFNLYLADLNMPENALKLFHSEAGAAGANDVSISFDGRVNRIIDAVMSSDLDDAAKVKVYNIIKSVKNTH